METYSAQTPTSICILMGLVIMMFFGTSCALHCFSGCGSLTAADINDSVRV